MINTQEKFAKINSLTESGYQLDIMSYISEAWEIFKKNPGGFIAFILVVLSLNTVLSFIPILGTIVLIVISPALNIGCAIVARKIVRNEATTFNDFFSGFSRFGELFLSNIIASILTLVGIALCLLPGIYLGVAYSFVMMLTWFMFDGDYWATLERSRKFITKEWISFFLFGLLLIAINLGGALCCGVGLLVSIPVSFIASYVCFERLIGTEEEGDSEQAQI